MEDNSKGKSIAVPESNFTSDKLPLEVRVLVLEHDDRYLSTFETVLKSRGYGVIKCQQAKAALSLLVEDKSRYDVIISDAHLPDMDGLKLLLEKVGLEMGLPVVLILPEKKRVSILMGLLNGDCGYLIKPITNESLGQMLEQMSINKENGLRVLVVGDAETQEITDTIPPRDHELQENFPATYSNEADATYKRVKTEKDHDYASYDVTKAKKPRLVWTAELHNKFDMAVKQLLPKNAVPKKILECMQNMGVTNLTRENVASHLQKYRIHRKRDHEGRRKALDDLQRTSVEQSHASDGMFESIQSYTGPDQLPFPSLALDSNSNHAPDLPNHANINPLDSSVQAMVSSHKKLMANQLSDHNDGTVLVYNNWTVPAMQPNLQTNETPAQYFGINTNITDRQYCQSSEAGPSGQIMIDGAENIGNWSFDFSECENINVADTVNCSIENNAAVLEYLRMSRQYNGIPDLQTTSSDRMNSNSTIYGNNNSFVAGPVAGEEYYVNYGINAPYCNDIHVDGNAYNSYQNLVQPEQRYDGNDFMQKPFIQQSGSGLAKTK